MRITIGGSPTGSDFYPRDKAIRQLMLTFLSGSCWMNSQ